MKEQQKTTEVSKYTTVGQINKETGTMEMVQVETVRWFPWLSENKKEETNEENNL